MAAYRTLGTLPCPIPHEFVLGETKACTWCGTDFNTDHVYVDMLIESDMLEHFYSTQQSWKPRLTGRTSIWQKGER